MAFLNDFIKNASQSAGIYQMINTAGDIIYVGKAKNIKKRLMNYANNARLPLRTQRMISLIANIITIDTKSEAEALVLEAELIKKYQPKYNVLLKDDKSFPFLCISCDEYPRITKQRGAKSGVCFGPFISGQSLSLYIEELCKIFSIRTCTNSAFNNRSRPCLRYFIKRCSAPCDKKISCQDYNANVNQLKFFLKGNKNKLIKELHHQMIKFSETEEFENAAIMRDRIKTISQLQDGIGEQLLDKSSVDFIFILHSNDFQLLYMRVISYVSGVKCAEQEYVLEVTHDCNYCSLIMQYYHEKVPQNLIIVNVVCDDEIQEALSIKYKKKIIFTNVIPVKLNDVYANLSKAASNAFVQHIKQFNFEALSEFLCLGRKLNRIEIYDNSHLHGTNPFGGVVSATQAGFDKKHCIAYTFQSDINGGNDYMYLEQTLLLRLQNNDMDLPDLFIIDGGEDHLKLAMKILSHLQIPILAISKGANRKNDKFHFSWTSELIVDDNKDMLFLLQRLRDQAHNFIINVQRRSRSKNIRFSELDDIKGIGPKKKKSLLRKFGTVQSVSNANMQDLMDAGLSEKDAENVKNFFISILNGEK